MLAAIYCRLSVEDEKADGLPAVSESIKNQQLLLADYAQKHGLTVYAVYVDENYSGLDNKRPAFLRLIDDARHGRFEVILCKSQSRFTRDLETADRYLNQLFPLWGIRFLGIVDGTDTAQTRSRKIRQLNGLLNEWYCEDLSDNIRAVLRRKMENGQFIGSFAPYGYTKDPSDRHRLVPDPPAAAVVRNIYQWYLDGASVSEIAGRLTAARISRPGVWKHQCGLLFQAPLTGSCSLSPASSAPQMGDTVWSVSTVRRILTNPIYTGCMVQGKEQKLDCKSDRRIRVSQEQWIIVPGTHQPLVSPDAFLAVRKRLHSRRKRRCMF